MPANPLSAHDDLRAAYLRYFDTAFWLRDPRLMAERRRLLEDSSLLFTDPLLEPVLSYDTTVPRLRSASRLAFRRRQARSPDARCSGHSPRRTARCYCVPTKPRQSCAPSSLARRTAGTSS